MGKLIVAAVLSVGVAALVSAVTGASFLVCFLGAFIAFSLAK